MSSANIKNGLIIVFTLVLVSIIWIFSDVEKDNFVLNVKTISLIPLLESHYLYTYLHLLTFLPVFALSFDKRVQYNKQWKYLFPAIAIVATIFIIWDIYFAYIGVWTFNESYYASSKLFHLPIEEWLFFINVPFACVFIYECLNTYLKKDILNQFDKSISIFLIILFVLIGLLNLGKLYTATAFLLTGSLLLFHFLNFKNTYRSRFYLAFVISCLPFLLFDGILTGAFTKNPVVIYNPDEYLGIRMATIPVDDSIYCFLLLFGVIILFEKFRKGHILN